MNYPRVVWSEGTARIVETRAGIYVLERLAGTDALGAPAWMSDPNALVPPMQTLVNVCGQQLAPKK